MDIMLSKGYFWISFDYLEYKKNKQNKIVSKTVVIEGGMGVLHQNCFSECYYQMVPF